MRHVVLVVGPPCGGKTTWVRSHAGPDDLVIDWDDIAVQCGSPVTHDHPAEYADRASQIRNQLESRVTTMTDGTAYVIRTLADPYTRRKVVERLRATQVKVIAPPADVVNERASQANRRPDIFRVIRDWYKNNPAPQ